MTADNSNAKIDKALLAARRLSKRPNQKLPKIPGNHGLPVVGSTPHLLANAPKVMRRCFQKYGPVFRLRGFGSTAVYFSDVEAARLILMNKEKNFSSRLGWLPVEPLLRRGILLRDFSEHRDHRRILQTTFTKPSLRFYTKRLNRLFSKQLHLWPENEVFRFQTELKTQLLDNAATIFMGAELGAESEVLNEHFIALSRAAISPHHKEIPGSSWKKGKDGARYLHSWLKKQIHGRIGNKQGDFFTTLCNISQQAENKMSLDDVVDHTVLLLFAAHDTTTSTLCSIMAMLCQQPEWQKKLRAEMQAIDADALTMEDFKHLPMTDQFFKEVLRHYPPISLILRRCIKSFSHRGVRIPSNTQTNLSVYLLHHHPKYWTDPDKFDPERFSLKRAEHKRDTFQYLPFGAGAHKCLGVNLAEIQTKVLLFHLLRNFRIATKPGYQFKFSHLPMPLPKQGLPVKFQRI